MTVHIIVWQFRIQLVHGCLWSLAFYLHSGLYLFFIIQLEFEHSVILCIIMYSLSFIFFGFVLGPTVIVWHIHYYWTGTVLISTSAFCYTWVFIDSAVCVIIRYLIAWVTIERHIVIFHPRWFATPINRVFFHYLPLILYSLS